MLSLNVHLYKNQQEEKAEPIGRYPVPYKKDLPFDIVELMDEVEREVSHTPGTGCHHHLQTFVSLGAITGTGRYSFFKFPTVDGTIQWGPVELQSHMFSSYLRHGLLGFGTLLCHSVLCHL